MSTAFAIRAERAVLFPDHAPVAAAVVVRDGRIEAVLRGGEPPPDDLPVVDAGGAVLMPGLVDSHVHVNEPGRTEWEGFATATRAAAAGGITTLVDMPLNSIPPTTTPAGLAAKIDAARDRCCVDYGFWGGLVRGNAAELQPLVDAGVLGFKAFMIDAGVDEFPWADEPTLRHGMRVLATAGVPLLVHAEVASAVATHARAAAAGEARAGAAPADAAGDGARPYRTWLDARPAQWETNAVRLLVRLVRDTGCAAHVVHLSAADALADLAAARAEGLPITVETCPHYLTFAAEEIPDGATHFKCAPPIRERANRERLWRGLAAGDIDCIVSDHSPCTPALKRLEAGDFAQAWGGIAGLQFALPVAWTEMRRRGRSLWDLVRWMSLGPARLAGLAHRKGAVAPGMDADLVLWDPDATFAVEPAAVHHRHTLTPYAGRTLHGVVQATYVRGTCVYRDGAFTGARPGARLLPDAAAGPATGPGARSRVEGARVHRSLPHAPFTELVDLASARLGGKALFATDDFFAPVDNLLKPEPAVFRPHEYTDRGKWMDGWESRRKRVPGHDWCMIRLGTPGIVRGVVVDTAHFIGNFPPFCWLEAADSTPDARGEGVVWREIVPRASLRGGAENLFPVADDGRFTHVRLHIEPDGGVARLRVHGVVVPDWKALRATGELVDLASVLNGGTVAGCNDMFFGPKDNLIMPGRGTSMADGWETRRRREPGNDWIALRLGRAGRIRRVEVDTAHFKGNFPESCSLEACRRGSAALAPDLVAAGTDVAWRPVLPRTRLEPDRVHTFEIDPGGQSVDHVRLCIYPDGGVSRLRVWCEPDWDAAG